MLSVLPVVSLQVCAQQFLLMTIFLVMQTETEIIRHIGFLNLFTTCASIPYKLDLFFLSHTCDKTKRTMKENWYETNSKENPVWNKWQPRSIINNVQPCGLEHIKIVTQSKRHW